VERADSLVAILTERIMSFSPVIKLHFPQHKCLYRVLEYWGTPAAQNHPGLHLKQHLMPYDYNDYNSFLGIFTVASDALPTVRQVEPARSACTARSSICTQSTCCTCSTRCQHSCQTSRSSCTPPSATKTSSVFASTSTLRPRRALRTSPTTAYRTARRPGQISLQAVLSCWVLVSRMRLPLCWTPSPMVQCMWIMCTHRLFDLLASIWTLR
jgi:hypothetical protein